MVQLNRIFDDLEKRFGIVIEGMSEGRERPVDGVKFLCSPQDEECVQDDLTTLFIGSGRQISSLPPSILPACPVLLTGCREKPAPARDFFYITEADLPEQALFNAIQNLIISSGKLEHCKNELFDLLYKGEGVVAILKTAYKHLNNPLTLNDSSFAQIDSFPPEQDYQIHYQEVNGKRVLRSIFLQNMQNMDLLKKLLTSSSPLVTKLEDVTYDWIFCGIRIGNSLVAYICVRCMEREYSEFDLEYVEILVKVLSIIMQKMEIFHKPTGQANEYFLKNLLDNAPKDKSFIRNRLLHLGEKPFPYNHIVVFDTASSAPKSALVDLYTEQLRTILPDALITYYENDLTLLLRTKTSRPFTPDRENRIISFLKLNGLYAVVSYPFTELEKTGSFYRHAQHLLLEKALLSRESPLLFYSDHYLEDLFIQIKQSAQLESMIHPHILEIEKYDRAHNSEYLKTLTYFLRYNRNVAEAAQNLNIHRSTFFYRMTRLADLFGIDENRGTLLFAYEYSLRLLSYLKARGMIINE